MAFLDHFTGTVLDSRWVGIKSGNSNLDVANGYLRIARNNNSAVAYAYYGTQLSPTSSGLWKFCVSTETLAIDFPVIGIRSTSTPGTPLNYDNYASYAVRCQTGLDAGKLYMSIGYMNGSSQFMQWNPNTQVFENASYYGSEKEVGNSNYIEIGIEFDGTNQRFRLMCWTIKAPSTSYVFEQGGPRLMQLSDWVNWSATAGGGNNLYLFLGDAYNNTSGGAPNRIEWVRYEDGAKVHAFGNGQEFLGTGFDIRKLHGFGETLVPIDRTTIAIPKGTGWDANTTHGPSGLFDDPNYIVYYSGHSGSNYSIGVASHTNPEAVLTKYGSNPIVTASTLGSGFTDVFFPYVIKDVSEPDSNKRFKMAAVALTTGGKFQIVYLTAPAYTGTWTYQGVIISEGGSGDPDEIGVTNPVIYWDPDAAQWIVFFARKRPDPSTGSTIEDVSYATGSALTSLTKSGVSFITWQSDGEEALTAALNGNTASISSNTGFVPDGIVLFKDSSAANSDYSISRIRVVNAGDLELYHRLDGFPSSPTTMIIQADRAHGQYLKHVEKVGSEYRFWGVLYRYGDHLSSSYRPYIETTALWKHSGSTPTGTTPVLDHLLYPVHSQTYFGHQRSAENVGFPIPPLVRDLSHNLTANSITSSPVVGNPTIGQKHVLSSTGITSSPVVSNPTIGQIHILSATGITSGSVVSNPTIGQSHPLTANGITASPIVGNPTITQIHILSATGITTSPIVGNPTITQIHILSAVGITSNPVVGNPTLTSSGVHNLTAIGITSGPIVGNPTIEQIHILVANSITSNPSVGAPTLTSGGIDNLTAIGIISNSMVGNPTIEQIHILVANSITTSPVVGNPTLTSSGIDSLIATGIVSNSVVGNPAIGQIHELTAINIISNSVVGNPTLQQVYVLIAVGITTTAMVDTPQIGQINALLSNGITTSPVVGNPNWVFILGAVFVVFSVAKPTVNFSVAKPTVNFSVAKPKVDFSVR